LDITQQELSVSDAASFLEIFAELSDIFIFTSAINLGEVFFVNKYQDSRYSI
jgi:hypothetical protein